MVRFSPQFCGTLPKARSPRGARAQSRQKERLVPLSSTKMRSSGRIAATFLRCSTRRRSTRFVSRSLACRSFFFSREPQPQNRSSQGTAAYPQFSLTPQLYFEFFESGIGRFGYGPGKLLQSLSIKSWRMAASMRPGRCAPGLSDPAQEIAHTTQTHPKALRNLLACAFPCFPRRPDPLPQIQGIWCWHNRLTIHPIRAYSNGNCSNG